MKLIKNLQKRKIAKIKARMHIQYKKEYEEKAEQLSAINQTAINQLKQASEIEKTKLHEFYKSEFQEIEKKTEQKYQNIISLRDQRISELEEYVNNIKDTFQYLKQREQDLENVMNLVGTKFKGFWELVANGYQSIENLMPHVAKYNKKHLKNDSKVIEAIK